jgi:hypothetical protein
MTNAEAQRRRRARLAERGVCILCLVRSAPRDLVTCAVCRARRTQQTEILRARRKEARVCYTCGNPETGGYATCAACRRRVREREECIRAEDEGRACRIDQHTCQDHPLTQA